MSEPPIFSGADFGFMTDNHVGRGCFQNMPSLGEKLFGMDEWTRLAVPGTSPRSIYRVARLNQTEEIYSPQVKD